MVSYKEHRSHMTPAVGGRGGPIHDTRESLFAVIAVHMILSGRGRPKKMSSCKHGPKDSQISTCQSASVPTEDSV